MENMQSNNYSIFQLMFYRHGDKKDFCFFLYLLQGCMPLAPLISNQILQS